MEDEGEMKIGTFDPDLKAEIDKLQAKIDLSYDLLISSEVDPGLIKWLTSKWYAEKWALVDQIGRT